MLFVGDWSFAPIRVGIQASHSTVVALLINSALITLFGLQHSLMARPAFKEKWTRVIPQAVERSTYVLLSGVVLVFVCYAWQPVGGVIWNVESQFGRILLPAIQLSGWVLVVAASFMINHFELFGLQQVWFHFRDQQEPTLSFRERFMYRIVRHPLQLGFLIGLWSTPTMTATHLSFAGMMTLYILVGLYFEERNLLANLGQDYATYRQRVRMLLPVPK